MSPKFYLTKTKFKLILLIVVFSLTVQSEIERINRYLLNNAGQPVNSPTTAPVTPAPVTPISPPINQSTSTPQPLLPSNNPNFINMSIFNFTQTTIPTYQDVFTVDIYNSSLTSDQKREEYMFWVKI